MEYEELMNMLKDIRVESVSYSEYLDKTVYQLNMCNGYPVLIDVYYSELRGQHYGYVYDLIYERAMYKCKLSLHSG